MLNSIPLLSKNSLSLLSGLLLLASVAHAAPQGNAPVAPPAQSAGQAADRATDAVSYQGEWEGRFAGDSVGRIRVTVNADNIAKVTCVTDETGRTFELSGPVEASGAVTAIENSFGPSGIKVRFTGQLTRRGTATGTWDNAFFRLKGDWQAFRKGDLSPVATSKK